MKAVKLLLNIISIVDLILVGVIIIAFVIPKAMGFSEYCVSNETMDPTVTVNSVVYDKEFDADSAQAGDIITYLAEDGKYITERIVSIDQEAQTVLTKGDSGEAYSDEYVPFSNICGKYVADVFAIGALLSIGGFTTQIVLIVVLLIIFAVLKTVNKKISANEPKNA